MAMAVFPDRLDKLDVTDSEGSLRAIEDYITYMTERVEFALTNVGRTMQGGEITTLQVLLYINDLYEKVDLATAGVNSLTSRVSGLETRMTSAEARLTAVEEILLSAEPILYREPEDVTAEDGETVSFSVRVFGTSPTYQWEMYDGSVWSAPAFSGADTPELTGTAAAAMDGYLFRCTVTAGGRTAVSRSAALNVT